MSAPALSDRTRRVLATLVREYIETGEPVASATLMRRVRAERLVRHHPQRARPARRHGLTCGSPTPRRDACRPIRATASTSTCCSRARRCRATSRRRGAAAPGGGRAPAHRRPALVHLARALGNVAPRGLRDCAGQRPGGVSPHRVRAAQRHRILVVMVSRGNQVSQKTVDIGEGVSPSELSQAANFLNSEFSGRTLDDVRSGVRERLREERTLYDQLLGLALRLASRRSRTEGPTAVSSRAPPRCSSRSCRPAALAAPCARCCDGRREAAPRPPPQRIHRRPRPHRGHWHRAQRPGTAARSA
jgi:heat-inducible transcriptional repressor